MKERPILFSAPMVRALLDGSKTQTRRVCKPAEAAGLSFVVEVPDPLERGQVYNGSCFGTEEGGVQFASPYGGVGDRLWVRETWGFNPDFPGLHSRACFRADPGHEHDGIRWVPSIHMPRAVSRLDLVVTGVRVERLQDISREDARAEGCAHDDPCDHVRLSCAEIGCTGPDYRVGYRKLWEQINGAGSWAANPWVWVVEFRRARA